MGWEDPLEKRMATHYSILAWRIPWTEEPGRLQSVGWQRVEHDWATNTFTYLKYQLPTRNYAYANRKINMTQTGRKSRQQKPWPDSDIRFNRHKLQSSIINMLKDGIKIMIKEVKQNMMTMSHQIENINTEKFLKKLILVLKSIKVIQKVH